MCGMAASNASPARSSDDDDDEDADVVHDPWAKKRRRDATPPSAPKRGTQARDVVHEKVLAAMRERAEAREDARDAQEEELAEAREDATPEDATPTLTRNENNQWSYRESVAVFESNDDVVAKLRARARVPSEREKRSVVLRAKAEREQARAETFDVGAVVGAAERENQRNESRGRW